MRLKLIKGGPAVTESELDEALSAALEKEPAFAAWFLARTPFRAEEATYVWGRSNHPWSRVVLTIHDAVDDESRAAGAECETDILAVYETSDGRRLALHIENKLADGSFTRNQPELYQARKEQWKLRPKLGNYTHAACVLIAPITFYERNRDRATLFDAYISHEDISTHVPAFAAQAGDD